MEAEEGTQEGQAQEEAEETKVEPRYEHIEIIVKVSAEGDSWFDRIFDLVTADCIEKPDDADDDWDCPCGMESMSGGGGTLDQCYDSMRLTEKWAFDVEAADLKFFLNLVASHFALNEEEDEIFQRLHKAAFWHDDFNEWLANLPDDEEEEEYEDFEGIMFKQDWEEDEDNPSCPRCGMASDDCGYCWKD